MDHSVLVGLDIGFGRQIVNALEKNKLKLMVAAWATLSEYVDPRIILAFKKPLGKVASPCEMKSSRSCTGRNSIYRFPLLIYRVASPFIKALRQTFGGSKDCRLESSRSIGGKFIEDMYIYNIQK